MTLSTAFGQRFLGELAETAKRLDVAAVDRLATQLAQVRAAGGRVFVIGVGGGAGNAAHAVCDLRGLAGMEAYAPTDNAAAVTATANDYGWPDVFTRWLSTSRLGPGDVLMVFSVGGGSVHPPVSENLARAVTLARDVGAFVCGIVGPDGGATARHAHLCIQVPVADRNFRTTHTEIFQSVVWHMLVTHPALNTTTPRWEGLRL